MSSWVSLLRVNEAREQKRISDKENRRVVGHQIPIALLRVHLDGETAWIACRISRSRFAADSRKSYEQRRALSDMRKYAGFRIVADVVGDFEISIGA